MNTQPAIRFLKENRRVTGSLIALPGVLLVLYMLTDPFREMAAEKFYFTFGLIIIAIAALYTLPLHRI